MADLFGAWPCWARNCKNWPYKRYNPPMTYKGGSGRTAGQYAMPNEKFPFNSPYRDGGGRGVGFLHRGSGLEYGRGGFLIARASGTGGGPSDVLA